MLAHINSLCRYRRHSCDELGAILNNDVVDSLKCLCCKLKRLISPLRADNKQGSCERLRLFIRSCSQARLSTHFVDGMYFLDNSIFDAAAKSCAHLVMVRIPFHFSKNLFHQYSNVLVNGIDGSVNGTRHGRTIFVVAGGICRH